MVTYRLLQYITIAVREYLDARGESPLAHWFVGLEALAAAKFATALYRLEQGNFSRVEGVGGAVTSAKSISAPVIGSTLARTGKRSLYCSAAARKKRQQTYIGAVLSCWQEYKRRKR